MASANIHTKEPGVSSREGAAFSALVNALHRPHIRTVVIPITGTLLLGYAHKVIDVETNADVLVMSSRGWAVSLSVYATLHEKYGEELIELLDLVLAGAPHVVAPLTETVHVHRA